MAHAMQIALAAEIFKLREKVHYSQHFCEKIPNNQTLALSATRGLPSLDISFEIVLNSHCGTL